MAQATESQLLTVNEVADETSIPVQTLYWYRHKGTGPKCARFGKRLMYRRQDLEAWISEAFETGVAS